MAEEVLGNSVFATVLVFCSCQVRFVSVEDAASHRAILALFVKLQAFGRSAILIRRNWMKLACITYRFAWSAVVIVRDLLRARVDSIRFNFDEADSIKRNSVGYIR